MSADNRGALEAWGKLIEEAHPISRDNPSPFWRGVKDNTIPTIELQQIVVTELRSPGGGDNVFNASLITLVARRSGLLPTSD
ncbi:hypothetical protein ACFL2C_01410 [Patescibacteria group bacterium]